MQRKALSSPASSDPLTKLEHSYFSLETRLITQEYTMHNPHPSTAHMSIPQSLVRKQLDSIFPKSILVLDMWLVCGSLDWRSGMLYTGISSK